MEKYTIARQDVLEEDSREEIEFGINNRFPKLDEADQRKQDVLFNKRHLAINRYNDLCRHLLPMIEEEEKIWNSIEEISNHICEFEGHRLSRELGEEIVQNELGEPGTRYYRTCLVCAKKIYKEELQDNDVVVQGEPRLQRILYHK